MNAQPLRPAQQAAKGFVPGVPASFENQDAPPLFFQQGSGKENIILSLADHLAGVAAVLDWVVVAIEVFALAIFILGVLRFSGWFLSGEILRRDAHERTHQLNRGRLALGRHILAGLEVLIVADLIRTVLHLSVDSIVLLAGLVLIRSLISFVLEHEMRALEKA